MELDPIKVLKCKVCNKDVIVNANYPIDQVTCRDCYEKMKESSDTWKF